MTPDQMDRLAITLSCAATDNGGMAPFTAQFGYIAGGVCQHDGIKITDAPASLVKIVTEWTAREAETSKSYIGVSVHDGGLLVS